MGLDEDVRSAVAEARTETLDLQVYVTHRAWTGQDYTGAASFIDTPRLAIVEAKQRSVRTKTGTEATSSHYVGILEPIPPTSTLTTDQQRDNPIDVDQDRFILPDGRDLPILAIDGLFDGGTNAPYYSQVYLG